MEVLITAIVFKHKFQKDYFPSFELPSSDVKILPNWAKYIFMGFLDHCPNYIHNTEVDAQGKASRLI